MDWKECIQTRESYGIGTRFEWPSAEFGHFDCTTNFTISDLWGAISWMWTYPGDWLLSQEPLKTFFEIDSASAVGLAGSTVIGFLLLPVALLLFGGVLGLLEVVFGAFFGFFDKYATSIARLFFFVFVTLVVGTVFLGACTFVASEGWLKTNVTIIFLVAYGIPALPSIAFVLLAKRGRKIVQEERATSEARIQQKEKR